METEEVNKIVSELERIQSKLTLLSRFHDFYAAICIVLLCIILYVLW